MRILDRLLETLDFDAEVRDVRVGFFHTGVLTRSCGLASTLPRDALKQRPLCEPLVTDPGSLLEKSAMELARLSYSEYLPDTVPDRANFPVRNRIISGMAEAVVVVEAGERSGALITAGYATEQGRELFAVPGQPGRAESVGTNTLIKQGACLLTDVDDIFEQLPRLKGEVAAKRFKALPDMTDMERKMVELLSAGPLQIDQLSRQTYLCGIHSKLDCQRIADGGRVSLCRFARYSLANRTYRTPP